MDTFIKLLLLCLCFCAVMLLLKDVEIIRHRDNESRNVSSISNIDVKFSPNGGCEALVIQEIKSSTKTIFIEAYQYHNENIAHALLQARKRGVAVSIIVDKQQVAVTNALIAEALQNGILVWSDAKHAIFHDKVAIIDGREVITGSFNYSYSAEHRNAENIIVIRDSNIANKYFVDWSVHKTHNTQL